MKAIITAAGLGTRMQEAYPDIPKVMLPVNGKPLLEHTVLHLKKYGFDEIFINLHFLPEKITNYFGDGKKFGVKITYKLEPKILGTAGVLWDFKNYLDETFLVIYGDIFTTLNFKKFLDFHRKKKSDVTLLVHKTDHPHDSDLVKVGKDELVTEFYLKPHEERLDTNLSSAAIYLIEPKVLDLLPSKDNFPLDFVHNLFPDWLEKEVKFYGYESSDLTKDMGTPERYRTLKRILKS